MTHVRSNHSVPDVVTPESIWRFCNERRPIAINFNPEFCTHCRGVVHVETERKNESNSVHEEEPRLLWNVASYLLMDLLYAPSNEPVKFDLRSSLSHHTNNNNGTSVGYITSLDLCNTSKDDNDVLLGLSTGEVRVLSSKMMTKSHGTTKLGPGVFRVNADGSLCPAKCVHVEWAPGTHAGAFVSVHQDGTVISHQKLIGNSSDSELLHRTESQNSLKATRKYIRTGIKDIVITAASLSPDGQKIALCSSSGVVLLVDTANGTTLGGFRSFFGAVLCCAWSYDGSYVAAGGEDDLIAVFDVVQQAFRVHCQGHTSWVTSVAFLPISKTDTNLDAGMIRLASVGQDCKLCLFEFSDQMWDAACEDIEGRSPTKSKEQSSTQGFPPQTHQADMNIIYPIYCQRVHIEPLSHVQFFQDALIACGYDGCVKTWKRE